jgi:hypothetical protein
MCVKGSHNQERLLPYRHADAGRHARLTATFTAKGVDGLPSQIMTIGAAANGGGAGHQSG